MDEETAELILALQMEDLELLASCRKGKAIEGSALTDEHIAVELQKTEVQKGKRTLADLRMARSIGRAVQDDGATVTILTAEERRSAQDRETAYRMSGESHPRVSSLPDCRVSEDILSRFSSLNIRHADHDDDLEDLFWDADSVFTLDGEEAGESSSQAAARRMGRDKGMNGKAKNECVACSEIRETVQVPCQHHYCTTCVVRLVSDSTVDESLFPPRCCGQEMPLSVIRPYITPELTAKFEQTTIEFGTPNRTYCYSCGIFMDPESSILGHHAHCTTCSLVTCILCKDRYHNGDCPDDQALEAVLRLAQETGWQRYAAAATDSATRVDRNGRPARAFCMTKTCSSNGLTRSHTEMQMLEPQHQQRVGFSKSRTICENAMTAIIEAGGVGSRVRIAARSVAFTCASSSSGAAIACFRLVCGAGVTVCDYIDALSKVDGTEFDDGQ
ncbi:MAG: hypothetical protein Q9163_001739, partial [Psora crenata]